MTSVRGFMRQSVAHRILRDAALGGVGDTKCAWRVLRKRSNKRDGRFVNETHNTSNSDKIHRGWNKKLDV